LPPNDRRSAQRHLERGATLERIGLSLLLPLFKTLSLAYTSRSGGNSARKVERDVHPILGQGWVVAERGFQRASNLSKFFVGELKEVLRLNAKYGASRRSEVGFDATIAAVATQADKRRLLRRLTQAAEQVNGERFKAVVAAFGGASNPREVDCWH
jgi:hypothetical protein